MTDVAPPAARRAFVRVTLWPGVAMLVAGVILGAVIFSRGNHPFPIDTRWNELLAAWESPVAHQLSLFMNRAGGGLIGIILIPAAGIIVLLVLRRPWSAAYLVAAEAGSALVVQVLKHTFGRARPEDIQVVSDQGSYPSGHVANATTLAVVLVVLLPRIWTIVVGSVWVVVMAFSRTYLHAHWLTDTLGGALVGAGAGLVIAAAFAVPLLRERGRPIPGRTKDAAG